MKIKTVFNRNDPRQEKYIRFLEKSFPETIIEEDPDMYFVIGGDGAMLHAHKHMTKDIPFFGKSMGTVNFIMNSFNNDFSVIEGLLNDTLKPIIIKTPKIKVSVKTQKEKFEFYAINDVIIGSNISDWNSFEITAKSGLYNKDIINGLGLCISTPLGSTAFNANNKGKVTPIDSKLWSITGVVTTKNIDEVIKPQKIKIKILSKRCDPSVYIDGEANKIKLTSGDIVKVSHTKETFSIAFLDKVAFNSKRMKLLQEKR
jgi:NAD kinase